MDTHTTQPHTPQELVIPLWDVGARRPVRKERRRDTGSLDRHIQEMTGTPPLGFADRRQRLPKQAVEIMVRLWREADGACDELQRDIPRCAA